MNIQVRGAVPNIKKSETFEKFDSEDIISGVARII